MLLPKHPVYVISKGRAATPLTARFLLRDRVPFSLVIEPQELDEYTAAVAELCAKIKAEDGIDREGLCTIRVLPFSNLGLGGIPARNWCWEHAKSIGAERHWILDDNIRAMFRNVDRLRVRCDAGAALAIAETFIARYENIAVAGLNYTTFARETVKAPPFYLNLRVYSCLCIDNALPFRWRGRYNEDTDLCLQALANGLCTVLFNAFLIEKMATMKLKGGNTAELYKGDGRLRMARSLERAWPYVVSTKRRFKRPQHVVKDAWRRFDTPLRLKPGVDLSALPRVDEHGLRVVRVAPEIKDPKVKRLHERLRK